MKSKKTFSTIGMIVSALIVITGILTISGVFGGDEDYPPYYYDCGYASFGGDFYSYVNNNAAKAARNVVGLVSFTRSISGISMICVGLLSLCYFGMAHSECAPVQKKDSREPQPEAYPFYTTYTTMGEPEAPDTGAEEEPAASCDSSDDA